MADKKYLYLLGGILAGAGITIFLKREKKASLECVVNPFEFCSCLVAPMINHSSVAIGESTDKISVVLESFCPEDAYLELKLLDISVTPLFSTVKNSVVIKLSPGKSIIPLPSLKRTGAGPADLHLEISDCNGKVCYSLDFVNNEA